MNDFRNIIGQKELIAHIKGSILNNNISHAYILTGSKGIGKKTLAKAFAASILCKDSDDANPCFKCQSCVSLKNNSNPDYFCLEEEKASISVDSIRDVQKTISIKPMVSPKKVYIIVDADKMTVQAQNCLLKSFEEPPEFITILLTVDNKDKLIETILSRAVIYNLKNNTTEEVENFLRMQYGNEFRDSTFIAKASNGIIGNAIKMAESEELLILRDNISSHILKMNFANNDDISILANIFEENKNEADVLFDIMLLFYRDLLVVKTSKIENKLINFDKKDVIIQVIDNFSVYSIIKSIEVIEDARMKIKSNVNYQMVIEVMLMKLQEEL